MDDPSSVFALGKDQWRHAMTPELWDKVKTVVATALELQPDQRASYLDRSCEGDSALRAEVEQLLEHEAALNSRFLNQTDLAEAALTLLPEDRNSWGGRRVGSYETADLIGAGGMGEVYRAFRADDQYRKQVALKLIRDGHHSGAVARFRNERQILATLEHPNIARLLDGGTAENGLPYFVMELVEGEPIHQYCASHNLSIAERLALFLEVCAAVQYAHQRLIIHRDIKPGNILVTKEGIPKLLDFGIAKILDPSESERVDSTITAFRMLTPQYASPEQVKGEPITTASDVYSLGVVLYELLTGNSPYGSNPLSTEERAAAVCQLEPVKPSTAMRKPRAGRAGQRSARGAATPFRVASDKVERQFRGDLDNIVLMALRKEPQRRYSSVEQFAEDVRRHLQNKPVIARRDTPAYRVSKFIARHQAGVAVAIVVLIILITGILITLREARIAKHRFDDVRSLANSLIFDVHDSIKDLPGSTPARKIIVDRALQYLNSLAQESSGDIQLQRELATAYEKVGAVQGDYLEHNLGDFAGTLSSYKTSLDLRKRIAAESKDWNDRLALAKAYRLVGHQLWAVGDPAGARDPINRAIAISEELNAAVPSNPKILYELSFDHVVSGRTGFPGDPNAKQKVLQDYQRAMAIDEILLKMTPDDLPTLHGYSTDLGNVGNMLESIDPTEALKSYQKELEIDRKLTQLSTDLRYRRSLAIDYGSIASVYDEVGDYSHALENNAKDLSMYQEIVQSDPKNALLQQGFAITYMNTANSYARLGQFKPALDYSRRGLEIIRPLVSAAPEKSFQQYVFALMLSIHGTILTAANQPEAAILEIEHGRSILESLAKTGATNVVNVAASEAKLGQAAAKSGHDQKSEDYFHQALSIVEPMISGASPDLDALYAAADVYSGLGDLSANRAQAKGLSAKERKLSWAAAKNYYQHSLNAWHQIPHPNHSAPNSFPVGDPVIVAEQFKRAEAAVASAH